MRLVALFSAFLLVVFIPESLCRQSLPYFPGQGKKWEERAPDEFDINRSKLDKAVQFALSNEYSGSRDLKLAILEAFAREPYHRLAGPAKERGGPAGVVLKNGYIIAQWGDPSLVEMTFSVTKSYLSTVVGLAFDQRKIVLNQPVKNYVWDGTFDGTHNSKITWGHLLTQSSDWSGTMFGMADWADRPPREGGIDEWKNRPLNPPGTVFEYNDVRVNVLAYSIMQVLRKPLPVILKEQIMDPIGASSTWRWYGYDHSWVELDGQKYQSVSGGGHSGGGMFINTYDQARFGLLFLNNGNWNGKQLISREWVDLVQQSSDANASYGYMWWLNRGKRKWEGLSEKIYYAAGFGGNFIVIDKEKNLVIVTRWLEPSKIGKVVRLVEESF